MASLIKLFRNESGATTVEISVILALTVVIVVTAAMTLGRNYCP